MKKIVRQNTFETNSSSSHSLVVTKSNKKYSNDEIERGFWPDRNGVLHFWANDLTFDRNPDTPLVSFKDKLRYLIASYGYVSPEELDELLAIVKKYAPKVKSFKFEDDMFCYGYIDHQSVGIVTDYIMKNNISLEEFLVNKRYIIILDGDEYCMWDTMKESGLVNLDFIEEEYEG